MRALFDASRPGKAPSLDQQEQQRILGVVFSPPERRARWTVRLLTEEAIKRKLVPRVGRETIRVLLESHDLKPWREKMWRVGELDEENGFIHNLRYMQPAYSSGFVADIFTAFLRKRGRLSGIAYPREGSITKQTARPTLQGIVS